MSIGTGHSMRVSTTSLISGAMVVGDVGHGVLGSDVPSTGDAGAGYLYNDLSLPADANKEVRGEIVTWPTHGDLVADENSAFSYTPDHDYVGADNFEYQLYVDGVAIGSPVTVDLTIVNDTQYITVGETLQSNQTTAVTISQTHEVSVGNVTQAATVSQAAINQETTATLITVENVAQANTVSSASTVTVTLITGADLGQSNAVSSVSVLQTNLVSGANVTQANSVSSVRIGVPGGTVWLLESQVEVGVSYGPTGIEYLGSLNTLEIKLDITSGQLVKPLSNKVVMTL